MRKFTLFAAISIGLFSSPSLEAQQGEKLPKIGYLSLSSSEAPGDTAFIQGLRDLGGWTAAPL